MIEEINGTLEKLVPEKGGPSHTLFEAARYSLLSPGKRIRPCLTLGVGEMLGATREALLVPACSVELIHAYSLIHDDLPAMDDDDFRRGLPTLHKVYGEGEAILAGDFLLTYAFEVLADAPLLDDSTKLTLIKTLAQAAGGEGMVGGQFLDIGEEKAPLDVIHARKTGALFKAAVLFGGIIANASPTTLKILSTFGEHIGLLFQLCDDILDDEGDHETRQKAHATYARTTTLLDTLPGNPAFLKELSQKIMTQIA